MGTLARPKQLVTPAGPKQLGQGCPSYLLNRRHFLHSSLALSAGLAATLTPNCAQATETQATEIKTTQTEPKGFFTLGKRKDHWWLLTPDGKPFFTMGLNHIDPASLRYPENYRYLAQKIWRQHASLDQGVRRTQSKRMGIQYGRAGCKRSLSDSGGIRAHSQSMNTARSTCLIAICSRSPNHINGKSTQSITIFVVKIGRNGLTMLHALTARSLRTKKNSLATSTVTVQPGLTIDPITIGVARSLIRIS